MSGRQKIEFITPLEAATILRISTNSAINRFDGLPGVVDIGSKETRHKRRYRELLIPTETFERYLVDHGFKRAA